MLISIVCLDALHPIQQLSVMPKQLIISCLPELNQFGSECCIDGQASENFKL